METAMLHQQLNKFSNKLEMEVLEDEVLLLCFWCNGDYQHHDRITVFDRGEDAATTKVTEVEGGSVTTLTLPSQQTRNPSSRRDGVAIRFYCEHCRGLTELTVEQHKGQSFLSFRPAGQRMESDQTL
jgi:hypothetical protein